MGFPLTANVTWLREPLVAWLRKLHVSRVALGHPESVTVGSLLTKRAELRNYSPLHYSPFSLTETKRKQSPKPLIKPAPPTVIAAQAGHRYTTLGALLPSSCQIVTRTSPSPNPNANRPNKNAPRFQLPRKHHRKSRQTKPPANPLDFLPDSITFGTMVAC